MMKKRHHQQIEDKKPSPPPLMQIEDEKPSPPPPMQPPLPQRKDRAIGFVDSRTSREGGAYETKGWRLGRRNEGWERQMTNEKKVLLSLFLVV